MLDELRQGVAENDSDREDGDPWPDENQPSDYFRFLSQMKHLANHGTPPHARAVGELQDGIWEFKRGGKRITFYDTDGRGNFSPKRRVADVRDAKDPNERYWWFPYFEDTIRLGHAFMKPGQKAGDKNIQLSLQVREEDIAHDRPSSGATKELET